MNLNKRRIVFYALLLAAGFSWWLLRSVEPPLPLQPSEARHDPDYFLEDFILTVMDEDGIPRHRLNADDLYHYPDDDTATMDKPHLVIYRDQNDHWDIRSDKGVVSSGGDAVALLGEVAVVRNVNDVADLQIFTSDLNVRPADEYAETVQAVTIRHLQGVTEAVGMQADLRDRRLQLLSQVRGVYEPANENK